MRLLTFALLAVFASVASSAEPEGLWSGAGPALDDMPVVLTPARLSQPQSQVPASVTIIDRELIDASGAREIYQLLQLVPGMSAVKVDGNVPTVSYHGTQARDVRRMLVLIDGRSQYQPGLARVLWNSLPIEVEDVERIEITRGPASAAYGANAFQGVINIITRHPAEMEGLTLAHRQGNNGVADWRLSSAAGSEGRSARLTVAQKHDHGYDDEDWDNRDEKTVQTLNLRSVFDLTAVDSLEFLAGGSRTTLERPREGDLSEILAYDNLPEDRTDHVFAQLRWQHQFSASHQLRAQAYAQYTDGAQEYGGCFALPGMSPDEGGAVFFSRELRDLFEANGRDIDATLAAFPGDPAVNARLAALYGSGAGPLCSDLAFDIREQRYDLEIEDTLDFGERGRLVAGVNLRHDQVESAAYLDGNEENFSQRVFGNLELRLLRPLLLNLGGYWEKDEINGTFFSPRSALIYNFLPSHSLRVVVAESLRTMDIYEKKADVHLMPLALNEPYASDPVTLLGWSDPEFFVTQASDGRLDPERIKSRELGYFGRIGPFEWDLRVFEEELKDLVSGSLNPFVFRPDNRARVDIHGREVQIGWRPHPQHLVRVTGAHIHTYPYHPDGISFTRIEQRLAPTDTASLLWRWDVTPRLMFSAAGYLAHHYNDTNAENRTTYERADAQVRWRRPFGDTELELSALLQRDLVDDPVVFEENLYEDDKRYWMTAALKF